MDKPESRQSEMDERYRDSITWRNTVREEDKKWRQRLRQEDREWRELTRNEDKAWRVQIRGEEIEHRLRSERTARRCCALSAAAQTANPGASPDEVFALARKYEEWLNGQED